MTSREIAELVEARHDNVKRTIETLAEKGVIAFPQIEEKPTAGRPVAEYVFTGEQGKRDSIIIVAQLSPEFTARLVDRWQALESQVRKPIAKEAKPLPPAKQAIESIKAFNALFDWQQKRLHLDDNAANIRANQAVRKLCVVDLLALTDNTHLVAENQTSADYTPSELVARIGGLSGKKVNQLLAAAGLQIKPAKDWIPTDKGEGHYVWHDTGKAHGSGTPVKQLKWYDSVLPIIEVLINQKEAA